MSATIASYLPRLDGLRFVAIGLVLVHHFGGYIGGFFDGGYYGVDLFFVISGYLITGILLRNPEVPFLASYRVFMGRRILRIFPIYYILIAILVILNVKPARELLPWLATYTFNYGATLYQESHAENSLYYLWSLSVEEQFYIVWPIVVLAMRRHKRSLLLLTGLLVVVSYAQLTFQIVPAMSRFNYTGLFNRMGSLGLGALGAIYAAYHVLPERFFRNRAVELATVILLIVTLGWPFRLSYPVMGLCSLFLVIKASRFDFQTRWLERFLRHPGIAYLGRISYGVYLFHWPIGWMMLDPILNPLWMAVPFDTFGIFEKLRWHSWLIKLPLYTAVSFAVAAASFRWIETPILSLKDRWFLYDTDRPRR